MPRETASGSQDYVTTVRFNSTLVEIPLELVTECSGDGSADRGTVRAVSFVYHSVEEVLPSGFPGRENELVLTQKAYIRIHT